MPVKKALCQSASKLFIAPAAINPTGIAADTIPSAIALFFSVHNSATSTLVVNITPPPPKPVIKRYIPTINQEDENALSIVNNPYNAVDSTTAFERPILSQMKPQAKPPSMLPNIKTELI